MGPLDDVRREHAGTPESIWRPYLLQFRDRGPVAELIPDDARIVIVAPHPDDETLGLGGLISEMAALGRAMLIVAVTDGEASHEESPTWPATKLASERRREQSAALQRLGAGSAAVVRIGIPDGQVRRHAHVLDRSLRRHLGRGDAVFAPLCNDGHPDHDASGQVSRDACGDLGALFFEVPIWMWHWAAPGDDRVPWDRLVRISLDADAMERKRDAVACHLTQLTPDPTTGAPPVLAASVRERFARPWETVFQ